MHSDPEPVAGPPARFPRASELAGRFVHLRALDPARVADALYDGSHGDAEREAIWDWLSYGPFDDRKAMRAWLETCAALADTVFYSVHDASTDEPIGIVSYLHVLPLQRSLEIGHIWYTPRAQRTKCNTEAAHLLIREAFELGYRRVEWRCNARNEKSRRAALRLGFGYEGTLRQHMVSKGRNRDTCMFSLLDGEWPGVRAIHERWLYGDGPGFSLREAITAPRGG